MVWSADFRAYGQLATQHVEEVKNPLRFQGQYFDDESGLHYNRHRYYCPKTGRFISPDPIGLAGGLNSYQYVVNPTGFVDPLGLVQGRENCPGNGSADNPAGEPEFQRVGVEPEIPEVTNGGAERAARYASNWPTASLDDALAKFAGKNPVISTTGKGKKIYTNSETGIQVVQDMKGNYFRIFDPNIQGRRAYLDMNGNIPNNKTLPDGKQAGRSQSEYNQVTHFNIRLSTL